MAGGRGIWGGAELLAGGMVGGMMAGTRRRGGKGGFCSLVSDDGASIGFARERFCMPSPAWIAKGNCSASIRKKMLRMAMAMRARNDLCSTMLPA